MHRTNTFSENKIIRSVIGGKVDGQNLAGTRSEKPTFYLAPNYSFKKFYLAPNYSFKKFSLAVKGLRLVLKVSVSNVRVMCLYIVPCCQANMRENPLNKIVD